MTNNEYLKENGFIPNHFGNFIYSKDSHFLNLDYLMNDAKELLKYDLKAFIKANPKATASQIIQFIETE